MSLEYVHSVFVCVWIFESHSIDGSVYHFPSLVFNFSNCFEPCVRRCLPRPRPGLSSVLQLVQVVLAIPILSVSVPHVCSALFQA